MIQDELHLITGALGTTVGLFEVAIDVMMAWRTAAGHPVRPLLVASTATARNSADQVRALYGRDMTIFPPQVIDAGRTFFSREVPVSSEHPGRRYVGISPSGVRLTTAEIRIAEVLLAAGQLLIDTSVWLPIPTCPWSATSARPVNSQVWPATWVTTSRPGSRKDARGRQLPRRTGTDFGDLNVAELTSRVASADITATLDQMGASFDPVFDSTAGKAELRALRAADKAVQSRDVESL